MVKKGYKQTQKHIENVRKAKTGMKYKINKENPTSFKKGDAPWNKGFKGVQVPWNKGLTKETDERVAQYSKQSGKTRKERGIKPTHIYTLEHRKKTSRRMKTHNPMFNPETREKVRQTIIQLYKDKPEILENRKPSGINQFSDKFTSIEQKIADVLNDLNIMFIHNKRIGRYFVDFLVFDNIVIECDGEYWHQDKDKDAERDKYLERRGYTVFRLTGSEINESAKRCIEELFFLE